MFVNHNSEEQGTQLSCNDSNRPNRQFWVVLCTVRAVENCDLFQGEISLL